MADKYTTGVAPVQSDGLEGFDEFTLDSFARGWDYQAKVLGNRQAKYLPPIPGALAAYQEGMTAADYIAWFPDD